MLAAAFAAAVDGGRHRVAWLALIVAIAVAECLALLHGFACITHRGNQVVSGVAINILVAGLTIVLGIAWFQRGGQTPALPPEARFMPIDWPGAGAVRDVPLIGPIYAELVSGHNLLVYVALLTVPIAHWVISSTRFGLRLRAVGEDAARRRYGRHFGRLAALPRGPDLRPADRDRRHLSVDRAERRVQPRHDRGPGLHRAGRDDLRQMAAAAGFRRLPDVRPARRHRDPPAGRAAWRLRRGAGAD